MRTFVYRRPFNYRAPRRVILPPPAAPTDGRARTSFVELETPSPDGRARTSFVELETPSPAGVDRRAQVSFAEMEAPDVRAVGRARLSFSELRVPGAPTEDGEPEIQSFFGAAPINLTLLLEQLAAAFVAPLATQLPGYIARADGAVFDVLTSADEPGLILFTYDTALTELDRTTIQAIIDNHFFEELTPTQASDTQDADDGVILADYFQRWKNLTGAEKDDAARINTRLNVRDLSRDTDMVNSRTRILWIELEVPDP